MAVYLRQADLKHDEQLLIAFARNHLELMDEERFRWLYRDNPSGVARVWLACDDHAEAPVGMAAVFPRRCYVAGEQVLGCVLGDFCISEKYRSLGPAVQLQKACLSLVRDGEFACCFDFPSGGMLGVYKYLGLQPAGQSVRMVKYLKADGRTGQWAPLRSVSGLVFKAADLALALRDRNSSQANDIEYRLDKETCSDEYRQLAERVGSSLGDCTLRSPDYLNWRYRRHPSQRYEFLAAYRGAELQSYCVFTVSDGHAGVVDLFGVPEEEPVRGLLTHLAALLRERGVSTVSISVLTSDARVRLLKKLGFWGRESVPVIGFDGNRTNFGARLLLMHGDRES
jgi:hypothetical protein